MTREKLKRMAQAEGEKAEELQATMKAAARKAIQAEGEAVKFWEDAARIAVEMEATTHKVSRMEDVLALKDAQGETDK